MSVFRPDCCGTFACANPKDYLGEHHPACQHAPPTHRNFHGATPAQLMRAVKDALGDETPMLRAVDSEEAD